MLFFSLDSTLLKHIVIFNVSWLYIIFSYKYSAIYNPIYHYFTQAYFRYIVGLFPGYHNKASHMNFLVSQCILKLRLHRTRKRQWQPTPVLLPGKSHGQRSLVGCSPWGREESDTTERFHFHFSLSCIGEGNDNALQCSCLENPREGEAWWAAVYGVAQSWRRLKRLSSSSSSSYTILQSVKYDIVYLRKVYPLIKKIILLRTCTDRLA